MTPIQTIPDIICMFQNALPVIVVADSACSLFLLFLVSMTPLQQHLGLMNRCNVM